MKFFRWGFRITWWFQVFLTGTWWLGFQVEETYMLNPSRTVTIFIIPGVGINIGVARIKPSITHMVGALKRAKFDLMRADDL